MAGEQFSLDASKEVVQLLDRAANQAGLSRSQAFDDFLTFLRCELAGKTMEDEYLATVARGYAKGKKGRRGIDTMVKAGGRVIAAMCTAGGDYLGDIFTGAITYGERGQFFTPESVTKLMAKLTVQGLEEDGRRKSVNDPACGSGRHLLAVGKRHPNWEFTGQDAVVSRSAPPLGASGPCEWVEPVASVCRLSATLLSTLHFDRCEFGDLRKRVLRKLINRLGGAGGTDMRQHRNSTADSDGSFHSLFGINHAID